MSVARGWCIGMGIQLLAVAAAAVVLRGVYAWLGILLIDPVTGGLMFAHFAIVFVAFRFIFKAATYKEETGDGK